VSRVGIVLALAFAGLAGWAGYWQVFRSAELSSAPDNPAVVAAARNAVRGRILDREGRVLATNRRDANGEPYRVYVGPAIAPVVGYSSRLFGEAGLEQRYDAQLVGLVRGDPVAELLRKFDPDQYDPQDLHLSLSLELQRLAVRELGEDEGAVVMLDPRTGEVLVLASTPTFDADLIAQPDAAASQQAFAALSDDPRDPLVPRATLGQYVPGSVFKIVTGLAALGSGAVTRDTTFRQQPQAEIDGLLVTGFRVRDGHHLFTGGERLDLMEATEVSCNIWYALAGLETGGHRRRRTIGRRVPR
jgi:peptidoglycan glycosyltransferase